MFNFGIDLMVIVGIAGWGVAIVQAFNKLQEHKGVPANIVDKVLEVAISLSLFFAGALIWILGLGILRYFWHRLCDL